MKIKPGPGYKRGQLNGPILVFSSSESDDDDDDMEVNDDEVIEISSSDEVEIVSIEGDDNVDPELAQMDTDDVSLELLVTQPRSNSPQPGPSGLSKLGQDERPITPAGVSSPEIDLDKVRLPTSSSDDDSDGAPSDDGGADDAYLADDRFVNHMIPGK